jgi:hypothetical protein
MLFTFQHQCSAQERQTIFIALIQLYNRYEWSYLGSATNAKAKVLVSSLAEQAPKDVLKKNDTAL